MQRVHFTLIPAALAGVLQGSSQARPEPTSLSLRSGRGRWSKFVLSFLISLAMYGIVIEAVRYMIEDHYGSATLSLVMEQAHVSNATFSTHDRYSEKIIPNILLALSDITGNSMDDVGILAGRYFIRFMTKYAQDLLKVLGRRFADFLKGLDSLHEYFRFSYERIRPPSFYCDRETMDGLTLHYRSRRAGYINYVMGQLIEIAKLYFNQDITLEVTRREEKKGFQYVLIRVTFDNGDYNDDQVVRDKNTALNEFLPVDSLSVLSMFPYFIAFNKRMEIVVVGRALDHIIADLVGKRIDDEFDLIRPCVKFTWDACQHHLNNLFELHSNSPVSKPEANQMISVAVNNTVEDKVQIPPSHDDRGHEDAIQALGGLEAINHEARQRGGRKHGGNYLHLKGPMVYLKHSEVNLYLPTVLIEVLDNLFELGLYMNDYSASDCNREIIMASAQKSDDLKELLKREKEKSRILAKNMRDIDFAKKTAKDLLSQLVPREIANELLQTGKRSVALSEAYEEATLAFTRVIDFVTITRDMGPTGMVNLLNSVMSTLDDIAEKHGVYKVSAAGDSFVISCGAPYSTQNHAEYVADAALEMIQAIGNVKTTLAEGKVVTIKIGIHSGSVVGCVVGIQAPKFCLLGDTVQCTSSLEVCNKQPMTVQVSVKTKVLLENCAPGQFLFENRGKVNLQTKGEMLAFGLVMKKGPPRYERHPMSNSMPTDDEDDRSAVYTPIDDFDDSRASTLSRMSISVAGSRPTSKSSSGHGRDGSDVENNMQRIPTPPPPLPQHEIPSFMRTTRTHATTAAAPPATAAAATTKGSTVTTANADQQADETRKVMRKLKEEHKEKRRQVKAEEKFRRDRRRKQPDGSMEMEG